jgi:hypothetical protein
MSNSLKNHVGKLEELYDLRKNPVEKIRRFTYYMLRKTSKNPMGKIGERYQHRNVFDVSNEKSQWGKIRK